MSDLVRLQEEQKEWRGEIGKMRREETYHLLHVDAWIRRLAQGAPERLQAALDRAWPDAQAIFTPPPDEHALLEAGIAEGRWEQLHRSWQDRVRGTLEELGMTLAPAGVPPDGRDSRTDDFRWLHGEFTSVAGSEAGATW